jgi:hypothetical protein
MLTTQLCASRMTLIYRRPAPVISSDESDNEDDCALNSNDRMIKHEHDEKQQQSNESMKDSGTDTSVSQCGDNNNADRVNGDCTTMVDGGVDVVQQQQYVDTSLSRDDDHNPIDITTTTNVQQDMAVCCTLAFCL